MMIKYERHPLSAAWPDMAREDFDALVISVEKSGLREPIAIFDGMILDGWHRYQACESLGIAGQTVEFVGTIEAAESFVNDRHTRRSVTPGQRAAAALAMYTWRVGAGRPAEKKLGNVAQLTTKQLAQTQGVSERTVKLAKQAVKTDAEALEKIRTGKATATSIIKENKPPKKELGHVTQLTAEKEESSSEPTEDKASVEEQLANAMEEIKRLTVDNEVMGAVFDADDKLAAATKQITQLTAENRALRERVNGLMNEKNRAISELKSAQRKIAKMEALDKAAF